jgi:UTP--glucose-1-phosphate uridylyltransferase
VETQRIADGLHRIIDLVEKPAPAQAPSRYAVIGRYVLSPEIFPILERTTPGKNREIQLTDALRQLVREAPSYAREIDGQRYDAGDKLGFLQATVEFALKSPTLGRAFSAYLKQVARR